MRLPYWSIFFSVVAIGGLFACSNSSELSSSRIADEDTSAPNPIQINSDSTHITEAVESKIDDEENKIDTVFDLPPVIVLPTEATEHYSEIDDATFYKEEFDHEVYEEADNNEEADSSNFYAELPWLNRIHHRVKDGVKYSIPPSVFGNVYKSDLTWGGIFVYDYLFRAIPYEESFTDGFFGAIPLLFIRAPRMIRFEKENVFTDFLENPWEDIDLQTSYSMVGQVAWLVDEYKVSRSDGRLKFKNGAWTDHFEDYRFYLMRVDSAMLDLRIVLPKRVTQQWPKHPRYYDIQYILLTKRASNNSELHFHTVESAEEYILTL